ncbi:Serine/threonine-protein kinase PknD [Rubripirellula obstinata]|uniref:Serine/threonine-protein kinase PknD n=1 Tax=Rubripirellula obstinata TaxID=406547 RepID=A0A5B1CMI1_9BACT|nr:protein kinase [Rubripirellula obstinata]KAA1260760.1 Serine/threonine-protein kinase PknD [Rubripirellula obstinata]
MKHDQTQQIAEAIFLEAVEMPADAQAAFIASKCGDDPKLKAIVESLLLADAAAGDDDFLASKFLNSPNLDEGNSANTTPPSNASASEADRFEILMVHDRGGLGEVLLARDRQLGRDVAVKQILHKWQGHQEAGARFLQEAEVTGRLEHPGVVPVYAMGTWPDGRPFYAMRFIEGKTLKQVIHDHREAGNTVAQLRGLLNRFIDVCNTIEYAHSRRIIHRDIKPSNIMVGPYGETLVVDWGLAKMLESDFDDSLTAQFIEQLGEDRVKSESSRTRIGGAVGTPQYMSPEQASGKLDSMGTRTDVYLLGATLYQILTGKPPHNEESIAKLIDRVKQGILIPPRQIDASIPATLEAICLKAMETDSIDRYASASELSQDIEHWLADEPVSVFTDPIASRMGRWIRKNRTLAMSGGVAATLLTMSLVSGSILWSYQQARNFKLEKERTAKANQLLASQTQRLTETRESAESAWQMSSREIAADRLDSAVAILRRAKKTLSSNDTAATSTVPQDSQLKEQKERITARLQRLEKLTDFYQQSELGQQYNVMSRDTEGIMASTAALKSLGVWDKPDWWMHLPQQDLNPDRRDRLRWDVYQTWLMLDGMLIKTIGTRLFGVMQEGGGGRLLRALRRMQSGAGIEEAEAAIVVSDRIDYFRQSESARWYRGIARYRTRTGRRIKAEDLLTPRNAPDAQKMGVLCLISAMDPSFRVVFRDYKNQDPILAGRDLFQRSASLRPDHYWTQLNLGQMQYFIASRETEPSWLSYQPAIQTMGRCIAINPKSCFAFADRSSLFRFQYEAIEKELDSADDSEGNRIRLQEQQKELLLWSIQDAQTAYRLAKDHAWVGWTYGMSLATAGQHDEARKLFLEASTKTFPLLESADSKLIAADDIRGRQEAAEYTAKQIQQNPDQLQLRTLLASICLNQQKLDDAMEHIEVSLASPDASAHAYAVRGMLRVDREDIDGAMEDFKAAGDKDASHVWAVYGLAVCEDLNGNHPAALDLFRRATKLATGDEHRAACMLGVGRVLAMLGRYERALAAFESAQDYQAACNIAEAAKPLVARFRDLRSRSVNAKETEALESFLKSLAKLPRATKVDISDSTDGKPMRASLLNGDFEVGQMRYWNHENGIRWLNSPGYAATAKVTQKQAYRDQYSLHVVGDDLPSDTEREIDKSDASGSTSQTFPIPAQSRCRLSVWVKTKDLEPDSARLEIQVADRPPTMLRVPQGQQDWTELSADFDVGPSADPSLTVAEVELRIVSAGPGEVWYDDIEVSVIPLPENEVVDQ